MEFFLNPIILQQKPKDNTKKLQQNRERQYVNRSCPRIGTLAIIADTRLTSMRIGLKCMPNVYVLPKR